MPQPFGASPETVPVGPGVTRILTRNLTTPAYGCVPGRGRRRGRVRLEVRPAARATPRDARTGRARPSTRPLAAAPSPGARAIPGRPRAEARGARQVGGHERHAAQQVLPRVLPAPGNKAFPLSALLSVGVTRHERQVNTPGGGCDHTPRGWCDECCQPAPPAPRAGPTRRYSGTPTTPTSTPTTPPTTPASDGPTAPATPDSTRRLTDHPGRPPSPPLPAPSPTREHTLVSAIVLAGRSYTAGDHRASFFSRKL